MDSSAESPKQTAENAPTPAASAHRLTRRRLFTATAAAVTGVVGVGAVTDYAAGGTVRRAASALAARATNNAVRGAAFDVLTTGDGVADGDLFLTDMGKIAPAPLIADSTGATLWATSGQKSYTDCRLQTYQDKPVITWWESPATGLAAYADGRDVITDLDHRVIATIEAHNGVSPDEHEFVLTPQNTALIVSYVKVPMDLSDRDGAANGSVLNGVFEEIDVATGAVLHHWESLDHVELDESYAGVPTTADEPYDYFHINSIKPTPDGHFLVSARHTWGVYKIDSDSGAVLWRFGGKKSDFAIPDNARFAWQHDVEYEDADTLRMFDNGTDGTITVTKESQILWFRINEHHKTTTLLRRFTHPDRLSAEAMGNAQRLSNGNVLVGWGTAKRISEFSSDGDLLFDASLPQLSYRAYRAVWR